MVTENYCESKVLLNLNFFFIISKYYTSIIIYKYKNRLKVVLISYKSFIHSEKNT